MIITTEAELRAALAATVHPPWSYGPTGPRVEIPAGVSIDLSEPLVIRDRAHCRIVGAGRFASRIVGSVILEQCLECHIEGLTINGNGGEVGLSIRTVHPGPNWPISSDNRVIDVSVENAVNGIFIDSRLRDANNEFHLFENVDVRHCREAGFRIHGGQAHRVQFRRCHAAYCDVGVYGEYGNYWSWLDGQCTGNRIDFCAENFWHEVLIERHRSEGSKSLFLTGGLWSRMPVTLRNITWDGNPVAGTHVVQVNGNGPVVFESVQLAGVNGVTPTVRVDDQDYGSVDLSGLTLLVYDPPVGDVRQRPVVVPDHFDVTDFGCVTRVITGGSGNVERKLTVRPPDDVTRGRMPLPVPRPHYAWGTECDRVPSPLPPASTLHARSFAVAFTVVFDEESVGQHQALLVANGFYLRVLTGGGVSQWRNEAAVGIDMPPVESGVPYRVVQSWDRDTRECWMRVNETVVGSNPGGDWRQLEADGVTRTGDWSWGSPVALMNYGGVPQGGGRLGATITDACCWDRSLSAAEVAAA